MKKTVKPTIRSSVNRQVFSFSSPAVLMGLAFLAGFLVRLIYILSFRESPFFGGLIVDAQWHDEWALAWAEGTWSMDGQSFFRAPLYPFWLSLIYRVFGHDLMAVRLVQALLGAGTAAALTGCAWRFGGRRTALWAAAISVLYGPLIYFDAELLIPNLLVALLAWSLFFLLAPSSLVSYLLAALFLGLASIARPTALVLLPPFLYFIWTRIRTEAFLKKRLLAWVILIVLIPGICITLLNAKEEGTFVFIASQGGVNLYAGNHPGASGRSVEIPELDMQGGWADFVDASHRVAEEEQGRKLNSRQVSDHWVKKALHWITTAPGDAFILTLKKAYYVLNAYEIPNNRDLYFKRPFPLSFLLWKVPWFAFPWGLFFPLAVVGVVLGLRLREVRSFIIMLIGWVVLYGVFLIPFFVSARFRLGLVPAMILLAAFALSQGKKILQVTPLAAGITALVLVNTSFFQVRYDNPAQELTKQGAALIQANRLDEGRQALRAAFEMDPESARNAYLLGRAYLMEGKTEEGLQLMRRSIDLATTHHGLLLYMGNYLLRMQYYAEAASALEKAANLRPDKAVWADLGTAYEYSGQGEKAFEAYRRSIMTAPDDPRGYLNMGSIYQKQNKPDLAITVWRDGAERIPDSFALHFNLALAYAGSGQLQLGFREVTAAVRIKPNDPEARRLYAWFEQRLKDAETEPGK